MGAGLSDHEQRILEEIERQLETEDPRLAETVSRSTLSEHVRRRVRLGTLAFVLGFVMLMSFAFSVWVAIAGFGVMLGSALFVYQQVRRVSREQAGERWGRASFASFLARIAARFRGSRPGAG